MIWVCAGNAQTVGKGTPTTGGNADLQRVSAAFTARRCAVVMMPSQRDLSGGCAIENTNSALMQAWSAFFCSQQKF